MAWCASCEVVHKTIQRTRCSMSDAPWPPKVKGGAIPRSSQLAARSDAPHVCSQAVHHLRPLRVGEPALGLVEREVHDIVVMNLLWSEGATHIQPDAVQQLNLLRREVRRVRP